MGLARFQNKVIQLAETLDQEWKSLAYDQKIFPDLCSKHLAHFSDFSPPKLPILSMELVTINLPPQTFGGLDFSDFPLTLVRNENFCVDIYYWNRSDTGIHDHHFHGAFKIIEGSSMQVNYQFETKLEHGIHLSEGELKQISATKLNLGDVEIIRRYDQFIHQVFHVEIPTVTLCIRTNTNFLEKPLSAYIYPKYKVSMNELPVPKYKWLLLLKTRLLMNQDVSEKIPLSNEEIVLTLYKSFTNQDILDPLVFDLLSNHLTSQNFAVDFIDICQKSKAVELKLKRLAIVTYLEDRKSAKNE